LRNQVLNLAEFYVPLDINGSFWRRSFQPVSWLGTDKLNLTQQKSKYASVTKYSITWNKHKQN